MFNFDNRNLVNTVNDSKVKLLFKIAGSLIIACKNRNLKGPFFLPPIDFV